MEMLDRVSVTSLIGTLAAGLLLMGGCDTSIEGQEGNLALEYDRGAMLEAHGMLPLAEDATLDYAAYPQDEEDLDPEDRNYVTFTDAMSSDDQVIMVAEVAKDTIDLAGRGQGEAIIDVDAETADGEEVSDAFDMEAATVEEIDIQHPCDSDEALYQAGSDARLYYRMMTDDGVRAVGTGYYPVEFDPSEGAEIGETDVNGLLPVSLADEAGEVTVESILDDASLTLEAVEEADVDGVDLKGVSLFEDGDIGEVYMLPSVEDDGDDIPVCQSEVDVEVTVDTDDVCEVTYGASENHQPYRPLYEPNALRIEALDDGNCEFSVELPEADGGNGVSEDFSVEVDR